MTLGMKARQNFVLINGNCSFIALKPSSQTFVKPEQSMIWT